MNCNVPTDICFSFAGFQVRGGATDVHSDGWGIAFFEGRGTRVFLDPQPSFSSPVAALVCSYPILTGAINEELEPMKAPSPITVLYLK